MKAAPVGRNFRRLLAGQDVARPLVWLWGAVPSFAVQNVGYEPVTAYNDPERAFDAQIKTIAMYGSDGIPSMAVGGASDVTWAFGGEIRWPTGEYDMAPVAVRHPVNSEEDAMAIRPPRGYLPRPAPCRCTWRWQGFRRRRSSRVSLCHLPHRRRPKFVRAGAVDALDDQAARSGASDAAPATDYSVAVVRLFARRISTAKTS